MSNIIHQFIISLLFLNIVMSTTMAQEQTIQPLSSPINVLSAIMPDNPIYPIKLFIEDVEEFVQIDDVGKLNVEQSHIRERIKELEYEAKFNNNKNSEKLIEKIQEKRKEIKERIHEVENISDFEEHINRSQEVITNLLNDPNMPESSRKGLMNAINRTNMKINMTSESMWRKQ